MGRKFYADYDYLPELKFEINNIEFGTLNTSNGWSSRRTFLTAPAWPTRNSIFFRTHFGKKFFGGTLNFGGNPLDL